MKEESCNERYQILANQSKMSSIATCTQKRTEMPTDDELHNSFLLPYNRVKPIET